MRPLSGILLGPVVCLALIASSGLADAADRAGKSNPWSAYFPAKGVTCTEQVAKDGVVKGVMRTTVKKKSAHEVVTYTPGAGRSTYHLLSGGRLHKAKSATDTDGGYRTHISAAMTLPSPGALAHHQAGRQSITMTMTVPRRSAHLLLQHGRTFRMVALYRAGGLGAQRMQLADADQTMVRAVGYRVALRSLTISNFKPAYRNRFKQQIRPTFAALQYTSWMAERLGEVRFYQRNSRGTRWTATSTGCVRRTHDARTTSGTSVGLPGQHIDVSRAARVLATAVRR